MKLIITIQSGTLTGRSWDFTEGFLTVGRSGSCNVVFDPTGENMVSTKHAYFENKPDGFYLVDTKSTNGTFVNGNRIQVIKLNSGDMIQFGKNGPQGIIFIELQQAFQPPPQGSFQSVSPNQQPIWGEQIQNQPPPLVQPVQIQQYAEGFPQQNPNLRNSMNFIGLSNPVIKVEEKGQTGKYIGAAIAIIGFVFMGLVALALTTLGLSVNEQGGVEWGKGVFYAVLASIVAFTPAVIYILPLVFLDRYDPEPPWLIASAFAWGAFVAIVFSGIVNTLFGAIVAGVTHDEGIGNLAAAVISAPIFEELSKGVGVVAILIFFRKEFDDILDGIVYGGVVGLGFATVENIQYYGDITKGGGGKALIGLFFLRGILSPFIHSTFTAMTGIGCGISRESHKTVVRLIAPVLGYFAAVFLHMIWNGVIGFLVPVLYIQIFKADPKESLTGFYIGYGILAVPFFLLFIGFCAYIMRRQNKILREMLAIDTARGLITEEQMKTATSALKSTAWLFDGLTGGKFFIRWKFLRSVGKLGLSYWHIQRANAAQGQTGSFQSNPIFRAEVEKWRTQV